MNTVNIAAESFKVTPSSEGVTVVGLALPFNVASRNGFVYNTESIQASYKTLQNKPVLFNHKSEAVIGHVKGVSLSPEGMIYEMDINPTARNPETGVAYGEAVARGDIPFVSIQCMYDEEKSFVTKEGLTNAFINEFLELSLVTIPGFADTTAAVVESYKRKREATMEQDKPTDEPKKEQSDMDTRMAELEAKLEKCWEYVSSKMKEEADEEKPEDEPKNDTTQDDEKKVEEAIRKDKVSVTTETIAEKRKITTEDVKSYFTGI